MSSVYVWTLFVDVYGSTVLKGIIVSKNISVRVCVYHSTMFRCLLIKLVRRLGSDARFQNYPIVK